jgi:polypyrimidine tract-binding protein 2
MNSQSATSDDTKRRLGPKETSPNYGDDDLNQNDDNPAPSRVIHFRNVGPDISQHDLLMLASSFGVVEQILMLKSKNQALLQFQDLQSSINFMQYYCSVQANIRGRNIYPQFSSHQELTSQSGVIVHRPDSTGSPSNTPPNRILLVTIHNAIYPITVDVLHQVFGPHGVVEKIVIFNKAKGLQALVQYSNVQSATAAKDLLHGQNIYTNGSCQLHIQYSNLQGELTVNANTDKTRDFTKPHLPTVEPAQPRIDPRFIPAAPDFYTQQLSQYGLALPVGFISTQFNSVLLVSNLNEEKVTCTALFNLFSNYGNVIRIKILHNKPDHALVQMGDYFQASTALHYLKGLMLFGKQMDINFSKHPYITATAVDPNDPTCADYSNSPLNRFKKFTAGSEKAQQIYKHMSGPGPLLHVSNLAPSATTQTLTELFSPYGTIIGLKLFEFNNKKQALVQFKDIQTAAEALVSLHNTSVDGRSLKVSFSKNKL